MGRGGGECEGLRSCWEDVCLRGGRCDGVGRGQLREGHDIRVLEVCARDAFFGGFVLVDGDAEALPEVGILNGTHCVRGWGAVCGGMWGTWWLWCCARTDAVEAKGVAVEQTATTGMRCRLRRLFEPVEGSFKVEAGALEGSGWPSVDRE